MELSEAQKNDILRIGRSAVDTADWYLKMCYGVETDKKGTDMFGALETAQMVMGKYTKQGEQQSITTRLHKFEFRPNNEKGVWYQLGSDKICTGRLYYKYSDGKNWSDFTREELEYIATQSCADVKQYMMAAEEGNMVYKENVKERQERTVCLRKEAMQLASTLPNADLAELIDNTERIIKWLEEH